MRLCFKIVKRKNAIQIQDRWSKISISTYAKPLMNEHTVQNASFQDFFLFVAYKLENKFSEKTSKKYKKPFEALLWQTFSFE